MAEKANLLVAGVLEVQVVTVVAMGGARALLFVRVEN